jgi:hypothetical protein
MEKMIARDVHLEQQLLVAHVEMDHVVLVDVAIVVVITTNMSN